MRISVKILSALLLIFVILFNTVSCDLVESFLGDTDGIVNPSGGNDQTGDGTGDDPYANFGKEYPCISVERALEIAYDAHTETTEKYYVVATITDIESLKNGHMTVSDDTGSILVYRSTDKNGSKLTNSGLAVGDVVIVYGTLYNYSGYTPEFKSAKILDWYTPGSNISPDSSDPYADVDLTSFYDIRVTTANITSKSSLEALSGPDTRPDMAIIRITHRRRGITSDLTSTYPAFLRFLNIWNTARVKRVMINVIERTVII